MTKQANPPKKRGRPPTFRPEYVDLVRKFCRLGATDEELAQLFNVSLRTLNNWKTQNAEFLQALREGKAISDAEVSDKLFKRATGYSHEEDDIRVVAGEIVITPTIKHYPPDTTACIFWLKNRQPDRWREKQDGQGRAEKEEVKPDEMNDPEQAAEAYRRMMEG